MNFRDDPRKIFFLKNANNFFHVVWLPEKIKLLSTQGIFHDCTINDFE